MVTKNEEGQINARTILSSKLPKYHSFAIMVNTTALASFVLSVLLRMGVVAGIIKYEYSLLYARKIF